MFFPALQRWLKVMVNPMPTSLCVVQIPVQPVPRWNRNLQESRTSLRLALSELSRDFSQELPALLNRGLVSTYYKSS